MPVFLHQLSRLMIHLFASLEQVLLRLTQPPHPSMLVSTTADLTRRRDERIAENALLRQPLIVLRRQLKKPTFSSSDRLGLVLLASRAKNWKEALLIFKPDTLLRWHRQGFRLFWRVKSRRRSGRPHLDTETAALIQPMA